jgi:LPXTG-motif cell wall-anchored protein
MKLVLRRASVGAAAFFAVSALAAPAAFADTTADLGVTLGGTTVALGTTAKEVHLTVTNHGPGTADGFTLTFDTTALDAAKVKLVLPESSPAFCDTTAKTCKVTAQMDNAENFDFPVFHLVRVAGTGAAGSLKVTVSSTTADPNDANNSATASVTLSDSTGVDLKLFADDIGINAEGDINPVSPGGNAVFTGFFYNQGTETAKGLKATITLPPGVTFADHAEPACVYSEGDTKAVCTAPDGVLEGGGSFDNEASWFGLPELNVKLASTVTPSVNIPGGHATIEALGVLIDEPAAAKAPWGKFSDAPPEFKDIDMTDNSDDFIVYVGGNLPKTGTNIVLIAGIGGSVLLAGGVLFLITRRRRVVA